MNKTTKMISGAIAMAGLSAAPLMADSASFAGPYIGVQGSAIGVEMDGNHNDTTGTVTTGTIGKFALIAGAELGYAFPVNDSFLIDVGASYVDGSASISSSSDRSAGNDKVTFSVGDHYTVYIAPTVAISETSSLYFKMGYSEAETSASSNVTNPADLEGETYAIGSRTMLPSGVFIRTEAGFSEYDKISVTGTTANADPQTGVSTLTKVTADPTIAFGNISIGYKF
jgi:hypothetical protein